MNHNNSLKLSQQLCHPIYITANALTRLYKPLLEPLGLTYPQYLIMMALWEEDGINLNSVSERTFFDSGTLTPLIKKLQKNGLIKIEVDKKDRRSKILFLTTKGHHLKSLASAIPKTLSCLVPFTKVELQSFLKMARSLHKTLLEAEKK